MGSEEWTLTVPYIIRKEQGLRGALSLRYTWLTGYLGLGGRTKRRETIVEREILTHGNRPEVEKEGLANLVSVG